MNLTENIRIALDSVRANLLRAVLTLIIIAFGIMALVGILTAIDSAIFSLSSNLSSLGANTFDVDPAGSGVRGNRGGRRKRIAPNFTFDQVLEFKRRYEFPADVSISFFATGNGTFSYSDRETNPNMIILGADENYLVTKGYELAAGRNITAREAMMGAQIGIIGTEVVDVLFNGDTEKALNKIVSTGKANFRVIGVTATRGSSMNESQDRRLIVPIQTAKRFYGTDRTRYNILTAVRDPNQIDAAIAEATIILRNIRGLRAGQENDFEISKSEGLISIIKENTVELRLAAVGIGLMTLLGAAIGLMNIMLVSVTERTREIGVRKSLGATRTNILTQFLVEAVVICQMGGIFGVFLGVLVGNVVTLLLGGNFLFPWVWITIALVVCTAVGLLAGLYPALRAAALDPIESLRYE